MCPNSNFGRAYRPYRCQPSDLPTRVTPQVKALLNNVSLMRNVPSTWSWCVQPGATLWAVSVKLIDKGKIIKNKKKYRSIFFFFFFAWGDYLLFLEWMWAGLLLKRKFCWKSNIKECKNVKIWNIICGSTAKTLFWMANTSNSLSVAIWHPYNSATWTLSWDFIKDWIFH